jgi:hypothetical protein
MERQHILNVLTGTLDPNPQLRKQAEEQLAQFETLPGFTAYCLELAVDDTVSQSQRSSAAVFFKNRVNAFWGARSVKAISTEEQEQIRVKLIESLLKACNDNLIRPQLTTTVKHILNQGQWLLNDAISQLLNSTTDQSHVYTGLLLLVEVVRSMRYEFTDEKRQPLNAYVDQTFPTLEKLAYELLKHDDYKSGEMMYYILKIFKYSTLLGMPYYLNDPNHLSSWISIHLMVVQKPTPQNVLDLETSDRVLDKRVKCTKWGFGNLQRFYQRYATPKSQNAVPEFTEFFNKTYVPELLKVYFGIIEKWGTGTWVSDPALYNLISFIEKCIIYDSWTLIQPHYDAILRHLLFPCLCQKDLELFEDDPEEYIRRYFDINRESTTADVAAVDALFVTAHHRFDEVNKILALLNEIFNAFSQKQNIENALKAEGGLRILSSISFSLYRENSPLKAQVDQIIDGFIVPLLTGKYEFLRARACESISIFSYTFVDKNVLSRVFHGVYENFKNDECMPIQIEAADALKVLITDPLVTDAIRGEVPQIVQKLMSLSKQFEMDMLSEIMETFVEVFSEELEPFAREMGQSLCQQFIQVATEMIELQNSGSDTEAADDKEYQGVAIINTMTTMSITMVKVDLDPVFFPAIEFVVHNAAISFLTEAMELLDSLVLNRKTITPATWTLFSNILESFGTYAGEFFDCYVPFFESVILYGFKGLNSQAPEVSSFQAVLHELVQSQIDYGDQNAFELVEYMTLVLHELNCEFPVALKTFREESKNPLDIIKLVLASLYVNPQVTLEITESANDTVRLLEIWYNFSPMLENVYGLKLQTLALISLLTVPTLPETLRGFVPQLSEKLSATIERIPSAISKRAILSNDPNLEDEEIPYEDDEDAFRDTPLDNISISSAFRENFAQLQQTDSPRYQQIFAVVKKDPEAISQALSFVDQSVPSSA